MKKGKRILAWLGIFLLAGLFLTLLVLTFTGAPANEIMAVLFCLVVIPVLLYAYQLIVKVTDRKRGTKDKKDR